MEKCNCKNESEALRIVRGNAFTTNIAIEAVRLDGSVVENFELSESEAVLRVIHAGRKTDKEFLVDGNNAIVSFDGTDGLGWYGLEMSGIYDGSPWRWCVENVFQLVETNEKANIPSWTSLVDGTYFVEGVLTLMTGGRTQADWDETNPMSASYIRNKPIIYTQTEVNALLQAEAQARQQGISNEATARQQADQALQGNITAEATARQQADATLIANIDAEETRATAAEEANAAAISAERIRATAVEGSLQENINTEEAARVSADQTLQNSIETEEARATASEQALQSNIDAEETARIAADQVLDGKIDDSTAAVAAEEARAKAAEQANATAISNEVTRAMAAEGDLQDNIDAEETARIAADNTLDAKIGANSSAIAAEVTRAKAAEQANATAISNEVTRATTAEGTLQDNIDDEEAARITADATLQGNIDAEEAARIAADQVLDGKITDSTAAVAAEEARAKTAEQANATAISNEVTRATAEEGTLQSNIDAEETARIAADNALDAKIGTNTSAIAAEEARAKAAEQANATAISNEVTRATAAEGDLQGNIDAEETARIAADNTLDAKIGNNTSTIAAEVTRATAAEQANATAISNEVTRATTAEGDLQDNIDAEETRAKAAEQANATAISNEVARATAAEQANATDIAAEVTRATAAEDTLQDNIDAEEAARIAGDQTLQGNINALSGNTYTKAQVDALIANFITASVSNLVNYYLKSETYTQSEVDDLIASVQQFQYKVVDVLPTASAATLNTIYLVPSPTSPNAKDSYVTIDNGVGADPRYTWEQIGSTDIDLSGYYTSQQTDAAITAALNTALANYTTTANLTTLLAGKQDVISDLATIRSGAAAGATAYQKPSTGIPKTDMSAAVQTSIGKADTAYQKPSTGIPSTDMTSAVQTSLGKADTAYQKPSNGIPSTDMTSAVQTSLGKADTAYQKPSTGIPESDLDAATQQKINTSVDITGKADKVSGATAGDFAGLDSSGNLTDSGKKASDFATAAQGALADTAYQKPATGIPSTDMSADVQTSLSKADTAYQKPSTGIPSTDLASAVQTSLGKADTAYQKPSTGIPESDLDAATQQKINASVDITGKADKVSGATAGDFAGLDSSGNLTDSGKKASDFATAAQGALADTAYQKPSTGIPSTDMSADVQTSLGKADTAYQKPSTGIPSTALASAVQTSLGKADTALQDQVNADWNSNSGASKILNKPTTMGASGSGHKGGLVPDTPSIAGTTKFLREDGTWAEPDGGGGGGNITVESNSAPTSSTTTYTKDGVTKNYVVGDKIIVPNAQSNSGYDVYVLLNVTGNTATWGAIDADDGRVIVTVRVYDNDNTNLALTTATIAVNGGAATAMTGVLDTAGHKKTFTATGLEVGDTFVITFGTLQDYNTPRSITGTKGTEADLYSVTYGDSSAVDLGLTSGTLWTQGNIMKDGNGDYYMGDETDYGCLFSWGNIDGHPTDGGMTAVTRGGSSVNYPIGTDGFVFKEENYWDWSTFLSLQGWTAQDANQNGFYEQDFGNGTPGMSVMADIASNDATHDAAAAALGGDWHMPSKDDFQELLDETDHEWVTNYNNSGVNGYKFMKRSDHSVFIFMPAIQYTLDGEPLSEFGGVWSRSFVAAWSAWYLGFGSSGMGVGYGDRYIGYAVRAVQ